MGADRLSASVRSFAGILIRAYARPYSRTLWRIRNPPVLDLWRWKEPVDACRRGIADSCLADDGERSQGHRDSGSEHLGTHRP